ncbi:MGA_1079 family surface serine endopeptidase [Mycoplasmopsis felifaucium]|uniref:ECM-binding protein homolog n=1 Tax=Mycoplasmopsis felifaucium TaxID=35768 RepID=A0ABZ2RQN2_9BACT
MEKKKKKRIIIGSVFAGTSALAIALGLGIGLGTKQNKTKNSEEGKDIDIKKLSQLYINKVNQILGSGYEDINPYKQKIIAELEKTDINPVLLSDDFYIQLVQLVQNYTNVKNKIIQAKSVFADTDFYTAYKNISGEQVNIFDTNKANLNQLVNNTSELANFEVINNEISHLNLLNSQQYNEANQLKEKFDKFKQALSIAKLQVNQSIAFTSTEFKLDYQTNSNFDTYLAKLEKNNELKKQMDNIISQYGQENEIAQDIDKFNELRSNDNNLNNLAELNNKLILLKNDIETKLAQKSNSNTELSTFKNDAKIQISNLELLTEQTKQKFNDLIDLSITKSNILAYLERAKLLNSNKIELNNTVSSFEQLKNSNDLNYLNSSNKSNIDKHYELNLFNDEIEPKKLKFKENIAEDDLVLNQLKQYKQEFDNLIAHLDGTSNLLRVKNSFKQVLVSKNFIDSLKAKISTWIDDQNLVSRIEDLEQKISKFDDIIVAYSKTIENEKTLNTSNLTQEQQQGLTNLKNIVVINFDNNKIKNFDIDSVAKYQDELNKKIILWNEHINELKSYSNDFEVDENFQALAQQNLRISLDPKLDYYDIKRYLTSLSFTKNNAKLYITEPENENINYILNSVNLKNENKNIVEFNYLAISKTNSNLKAKVSAELDIYQVNNRVNVNDLVANVNVQNLDELFDINYLALSNISKIDLNITNINDYIKKAKTYISDYFTFEIKQGQSNLIDNDNKLSFQVDLFLNQNLVKTLDLKSLQAIDFKPDQTFEANISLSNYFLESEPYFDDSRNSFAYFADMTNSKYELAIQEQGIFRYWFWKYQIAPFYETIKSEFNNKVFKLEPVSNPNPRGKLKQEGIPVFDKKYASYAPNELTFDEVKQIILRWFKKQDNNLINWNVDDQINVDFKLQNSHLYDIENLPLKPTANFIFTLTKGQLTKEIQLTITKKNYYKPAVNEENAKYINKIHEILADKTGQKLFQILKVKDPVKTNGHYSVIQGDPAELINQLYEWPKIGEYQIFARKTLSKNNLAGTADIVFWYKDKAGNWMPYNTDASTPDRTFEAQNFITIKNWKPAQYRDIKPQNGTTFTDDDFNPIDEANANNNIEQSDIDAINQLNARNFDYRKAEAERNGSSSVFYRLIDPADVVAQNASMMLNYVLTIKNTPVEDNKNNGSFSNTAPTSTTNPDGTVASNTPSKANSIAIQNQEIYSNSDQPNNVDTNALYKKYFIYFYDVKNEAKGQLSFKLGFINKENTNKRYKTNHRITLINLVNDYKVKLYPEVILNKIKYSDLTLNNLSSINASQLNASNFSQYVNINEQVLTYNNLTIDKNNITLAEIKPHKGNKAYIRLKYQANGANIDGSTWYLLDGFSSLANSDANLNISKTNPLTTIYDSASSITRSRELELYAKDALWTEYKTNNAANFTLKAKYLAQTFEKEGVSNRKIYIHLFGNTLVQNFKRASRITGRNKDEGQDLVLDYEELKKLKTITLNGQTKNVYFENSSKGQVPVIDYSLTATLKQNNDIDFVFKVNSKQYKLLVGTVSNNVYKGANFYNSAQYDEFNPEKAFLLARNGAAFHIEYTNNLEDEDFGVKTNEFNYNKIDFNQENQPIAFYSDQKAYDLNTYNPNQNVSYKLHDGYLMDFEFLHKEYDAKLDQSNLIKNTRERTFGYRFGSATMLAKVNNDPNDGKFYIITNNHVEAGHNFDLTSLIDDNLPKASPGGYFAISAPDYENAIDAGFSYWGGLYNVGNINSKIVWTGVSQKDKQGNGQGFVDITVSIVDINPLINKAKQNGLFLQAFWLENWFNLPNLSINTNGEEDLEFLAPTRKHYAFNGFPYGKQNGYIANRASSADNTIGFSRQNGYAQTFFNAGNSGTGVIGADNEYVSTINSGAPLTFLQSWTYSTNSNNYFGINWNNENPLELKNNNSLATFIMRLHTKNPLNYSLPWFFKEFEK